MTVVPGKDVREVKEAMDPFGDLIPYADPSWYQSVRGAQRIVLSSQNPLTTHLSSIILHISMRHTLPYVLKYENG